MSSPDRSYQRFTVEVEGGELSVGSWGRPDAPVVLAVHGITANHLTFARLAAALPTYRLVAPDLRGRGGSSGLPGPWGMARHAADVARVIEQTAPHAAVPVAGHSMGGFVVAELARTRPELVAGLLLIDGGLPLRLPAGVDLEAAVSATLGPALQRLSMTFPSRAAHLDFWRPHPALAADWNAEIEAYLSYDLTGEPPRLRSSVAGEAVAQDSAELFTARDDVLAGYPGPARMLVVDRGLQGAPPGLYAPEEQTSWRERLPRLAIETVPGLNHYTLVLRGEGTARIAAAVRELAR